MTKPITCIIVDDEPPAIRILQKYAEQLPGLECVATTTSALEALRLIEVHQPDILFLDIQMRDLTGIQLSALIKDKVGIIFTTAYPQFAVEGFELNAIDYLLKPIAFSRFITAVEKARATIPLTGSKHNIPSTEEEFFFIKTDGKNKFKRVEIADIFYIESIKNYIVIHTMNEQIVTYNTLKYFEEKLPENLFIKIHKSFIIAFNKIEKTDNNEVWLLQKSLPLGDTYKIDFFTRINERKL
ncbi:LytR/AlgR family response regulator transcription factor [Flavobacterium cerinum]|uniref:Response regulator transcription factor n=1 Tax=Flavobacterium cerinum TaxID=2502784 RepID=A0A3S3S6Y3_9FLAO|nr:LytTR family DNA-binding domain-containing protein [Flavobacterium cerinum]RWW91667.1 response regulator transcription factor [Flavobacterium cerinum]